MVSNGTKQDPPTRDQYRLLVIHGSTHEGITGILRDKQIKAKPWKDKGAGSHGCYGLGFQEEEKTERKSWNVEALTRTLAKVYDGNKDRCGIAIEAIITAKYEVIKSGGILEEHDVVRRGLVTKNKHDGRMCWHPDDALITGIWFLKEPEHDDSQPPWLDT